MTGKKALSYALVLGGLAVYLALFFTTRLPTLEARTGQVTRRMDFLSWRLLLPDELVKEWFGQPAQFGLVDRLPVLGIAGAILAVSFALGWLLMALGRADRGLGRIEVLVFGTAVGLNVLSTYTLLVGLLGWLDNVLVLAVPAALALASAGRLRMRRSAAQAAEPAHTTASGKARGDAGKTIQRRRSGRRSSAAVRVAGRGPAGAGRQPERAPATGIVVDADKPQVRAGWLWLAVPFAVIIILGGMLPPIDFDVREYHLQAPKEFFQQGRVSFLPHNVYANMTMGAEMHCLAAMVIAGDWWLGALAGKTVMAMFAPLTALALFAAGRRFLATSAGIVAALVYLSTPWIVQISAAGLVEGAAACYLFLSVYALLLWNLNPDGCPDGNDDGRGARSRSRISPRLVLAGYLAGSAVATKYPAVLFVLVPLTVWLLLGDLKIFFSTNQRVPDQKRLRAPSAPAAQFVLAALVGCGLWFGKNWAFTGNPTYPLLYEVFDGEHWSAEKDSRWTRAHRPDWPQDYSPGAIASALTQIGWRSEWLSPLVMPLAVLAFVPWWKQKRGAGPRAPDSSGMGDGKRGGLGVVPAAGVYFAFVFVAWWLLTHRIDRFWIPALPLVCLLAGIGSCWSRDRLWRGILAGLLILGLSSSFLVAASSRPGVYNWYFASLDGLRIHPSRVDPWQLYFNQNARNGCVLSVGVGDVFDLEVPVLYNTAFDNCVFEELVRGRTADQIRRSFSERGITHVLVHWGEIDRYRSPGNYGFTDFVQPLVFDRLVADGILEPLPPLEKHPGRAYRVVGSAVEDFDAKKTEHGQCLE